MIVVLKVRDVQHLELCFGPAWIEKEVRRACYIYTKLTLAYIHQYYGIVSIVSFMHRKRPVRACQPWVLREYAWVPVNILIKKLRAQHTRNARSTEKSIVFGAFYILTFPVCKFIYWPVTARNSYRFLSGMVENFTHCGSCKLEVDSCQCQVTKKVLT